MADRFADLLESEKPKIAALLAEYQKPERFFALAYELKKDPALSRCTPESLIKCIVDAANCGLEIGGPDKHCFIIPYNDLATFQPSAWGIIFRLVRAGIVSHMYADIVYEFDQVEIISGSRRVFEHRPKIFGERGRMIGAYAVAYLANGVIDFEIFEMKDIDAVKNAALRNARRRKPDAELSPAWRFFETEMVKKSVIRRLAKRLQGERKDDDAGERLARTLETDAYKIEDEIDPSDMPRPALTVVSPPQPPESQAAGGEKGSRAPKPPHSNPKGQAGPTTPAPAPEPPDGPIGEGPIYDTMWKLMNETMGMRPSEIRQFLQRHFGTPDLDQIKVSQVAALEAALEQEAAS
jgi:recombination protein RecT